MSDLLQLYRQPKNEKRDKEIQVKVHGLSKFLPEPMKAQEFLKKLSVQLGTDNVLLSSFEKVVDPDVSCKECQLYVVRYIVIHSRCLAVCNLITPTWSRNPNLIQCSLINNPKLLTESNPKENGITNHDKFVLRNR